MLHHKDKNVAGKVIGAGIIGALVGAVAGIFLSPKSGKENRDDAKEWMQEMQDEITKRVKDAHSMSQEKYDDLVDEVADRKRSMMKVTDEEWSGFVKDMKKHWNKIRDQWDDSSN